MHINTQRFLGITLVLATVVACGNKEETPAVDTATGSLAPPVALTVSAIDIGRSINADKGIVDRTSTFAKTDTLYASVSTDGSAPGTLVAKWSAPDGTVIDETTQSISPMGPARTEFHIMKPGGWPAGAYKVEIILNGLSAGIKEFEIK